MDSNSAEFFRQIPTGLILMFCRSGILFLGAMAYIAYGRSQRQRNANSPDMVMTQSVGLISREEGNMGHIDDDMPDLDLLSHHEQTSPPAPPAQQQPSNPTAYAPPPDADDPMEGDTLIDYLPARPTNAYRVSLKDGTTSDVIEVMTVLRDVADGTILIQIGDRVARFPANDAEEDFKRRLDSTLRDLAVGQSKNMPPAAKPAPPPANANTGATTPKAPPMPANADMPSAPGALPKFRLEDLPPATRLGRKPPPVNIPDINIGGSIETFLQHKRGMNNDFPGRRIHVRSGVGGSIVIEVDGQFYDAVGDVEDAAVRAYLQQTIEEWQRQA